MAHKAHGIAIGGVEVSADLIGDIIRREGGINSFTNQRSDRGGPTRCGITLPALSDALGRQATVNDLRQLTEKDIRDFYADRYVRPFVGLIKDPKLLAFCVDYAVNSGVQTVIKAIQRAVGVNPDGVIGPVTARAVSATDPEKLFSLLWVTRQELYFRLAFDSPAVRAFLSDHPTLNLHNLRGWLRRLSEFV